MMMQSCRVSDIGEKALVACCSSCAASATFEKDCDVAKRNLVNSCPSRSLCTISANLSDDGTAICCSACNLLDFTQSTDQSCANDTGNMTYLHECSTESSCQLGVSADIVGASPQNWARIVTPTDIDLNDVWISADGTHVWVSGFAGQLLRLDSVHVERGFIRVETGRTDSILGMFGNDDTVCLFGIDAPIFCGPIDTSSPTDWSSAEIAGVSGKALSRSEGQQTIRSVFQLKTTSRGGVGPHVIIGGDDGVLAAATFGRRGRPGVFTTIASPTSDDITAVSVDTTHNFLYIGTISGRIFRHPSWSITVADATAVTPGDWDEIILAEQSSITRIVEIPSVGLAIATASGVEILQSGSNKTNAVTLFPTMRSQRNGSLYRAERGILENAPIATAIFGMSFDNNPDKSTDDQAGRGQPWGIFAGEAGTIFETRLEEEVENGERRYKAYQHIYQPFLQRVRLNDIEINRVTKNIWAVGAFGTILKLEKL